MANSFSVDRLRFLAVAAAIAGVASFQACTVNNNVSDDDDGGEGNGGTNNTAGSSMTSGGDDQTEGGAPTSAGGASGTVGGATDEGGTAQGGATDAGGAAQGGAAQGGAGSCDDSVGEASCEGVTAACSNYCTAALANLKPAAAVAAVACLEADATGNCDAGYSCLANATAEGCAEDVTAACEAAATTCTGSAVGDPPCAQLLSGLNEAARAVAVTCTEESCFSVYVCAEGLFFE
jgi:hypothetical protein